MFSPENFVAYALLCLCFISLFCRCFGSPVSFFYKCISHFPTCIAENSLQCALPGSCQRQIGCKCEGLFWESPFFPIWPVCPLVLSVYTCSNCKDSKLRSIKTSIASFFLMINLPVSFLFTSIKILWLFCHFFVEPAWKFYRDHTESAPLCLFCILWWNDKRNVCF